MGRDWYIYRSWMVDFYGKSLFYQHDPTWMVDKKLIYTVFSHFSIFFLWLFVHFLEIQGPQAPPKNPKTEQRPETSDPILPGAKGLETMVSQLSIKNTGCFFWGSLKKSPQICGQEISSPKTTRGQFNPPVNSHSWLENGPYWKKGIFHCSWCGRYPIIYMVCTSKQWLSTG